MVVEAPHRFTRQEAAERAGMAPDDMGRLWRSLGFAELAEDSSGYTAADVDAFGEVAALVADGRIDLDLAVSMARPMGHLLSRLGAAQVSALPGLVKRPPDSQALPQEAGAGADALVPLLERLVVYAWRRHLTAALSAALPAGRLDAASALQAVGFIDIASYTALSRRIDWAELASLLERFEACVFDQVAAGGGRVVKTLGDEVLFVAEQPAAAAEIALSVIDAGQTDPDLPGMHAGLAYGPLLERAGDIFGPTVNIASRVTGLARPGAVLVDKECRNELAEDRRFLTRRRPRRHVRGYAHLATFRLWRARPRTAANSTATGSSLGHTTPTVLPRRGTTAGYR
jgi:adenylate cyclase